MGEEMWFKWTWIVFGVRLAVLSISENADLQFTENGQKKNLENIQWAVIFCGRNTLLISEFKGERPDRC